MTAEKARKKVSDTRALVRKKMRRAAFIPFLLLLIISSLFLTQFYDVLSVSQDVRRREQIISGLLATESLLNEAEMGYRGYLATEEEDYLEPFNDAQDRLKIQIDSTIDLIRDPSARSTFQKTITDYLEWQKLAEGTIAAFRQGDLRGVRQRVRETSRLIDELHLELTNLRRRFEEMRDKNLGQLEARTSLIVLLTVFAVLIGSVFLALFIRRQLGSVSNLYNEALSQRENAEESLRRSHEQLEKMVEERTVELQAANHELEAFAYSVSHDLRAPLRGIDGFSLALVEDYGEKLDDEAKRYLAYIRKGIQRMGSLIDDLLALSRLTRKEVIREETDLTQIAKEAVSELQSEEPDRKVDIEIQEGMQVYGDSGLLTAAIHNLLSNAWKFTSKNPDAKIKFGSRQNGRGPIFYVQDNGAGFNMNYVDKLFGAFQRLHSPGEFEGTGVGLATVRRIIRKHGGTIWAEGEEGKGATFHFTVPSTPTLKEDITDGYRSESHPVS